MWLSSYSVCFLHTEQMIHVLVAVLRLGGICFVLGLTKHLDVSQIMNFSSVRVFIYFGILMKLKMTLNSIYT